MLGVVALRDVEAEQLAATGSAMSMFGSVAQDFTADDMYVIASSLNTVLEREGAAERISCVQVMETGPGTISVEVLVGSAAIAQTTLTVLADRVGGNGAPITATLGAPFTSRPYQASSFEPDSSLSEASPVDTGDPGAAASSAYITMAVFGLLLLAILYYCKDRFFATKKGTNVVSPAEPAAGCESPASPGYHGNASGGGTPSYGNNTAFQYLPAAMYTSP